MTDITQQICRILWKHRWYRINPTDSTVGQCGCDRTRPFTTACGQTLHVAEVLASELGL